jgi:uncharacterized repeat protein (TIGR03803 family)
MVAPVKRSVSPIVGGLLLISFLTGCGASAGTQSMPPLGASRAASHVGKAFTNVSATTAVSTNETILYKFNGGTDGDTPSGLIAANGALYGVTTLGGAPGDVWNGTVFGMSTSGAERVIYRFKGGDTDGAGPTSLIVVNGVLYGTTGGGPYACGTVFEVGPSGAERVIYSFKCGPGEDDGFGPASLLAANGTLFGITVAGGSTNVGGTVFEVSTSGSERVVYSFKGGADGEFPTSLIAVNGTLYGATYFGGAANNGTIFEVSTSGSERVIYSFKGGTDGVNPVGIIAMNGAFYGVTGSGGATNHGAVFEVSASGAERMIYSFKGGADGANPTSLIAVNGTLYGTTSGGDVTNDYGTVFEVSTSGAERVIYSFKGGRDDGANPTSLIAVNGTLYGATQSGGNLTTEGVPIVSGPPQPRGMGTIFKVLP